MYVCANGPSTGIGAGIGGRDTTDSHTASSSGFLVISHPVLLFQWYGTKEYYLGQTAHSPQQPIGRAHTFADEFVVAPSIGRLCERRMDEWCR